MNNPRVNRLLDFIERVGWTAIQALAATAIVTGFDDWSLTLEVSGVAALAAALKVIVAQRIGSSDGGDLIPGGEVVTPPPTES